MSFIDSILGRDNPSKPQAQQQPAVQQQALVQQSQEVNRESTNTPINPLDAYAKIFDTTDVAEGPPVFNLDDKTLDEVSGKLNFISNVDQSLVARAQSGDAQALVELIQAVGQRSYNTALKHATALTDAHLNRRGEYEKITTANSVKQSLTNEALAALPNSSHPVVKTELKRIAENLARQNPDAPASEIAKEAQNYFAAVYNAMSPQSSQSAQPTAGEVTDWEKFLT